MKEYNIDKSKPIYCDSARPEVIEEIRRAGYNSKSSNKNVKEGIDKIKSMEIYIHNESLNILKEFRLYSWKTIGERILDEPVKLNDDILDAMRYSINTHLKTSGKFDYEFDFINI
jgi:phage terminase large subunit